MFGGIFNDINRELSNAGNSVNRELSNLGNSVNRTLADPVPASLLGGALMGPVGQALPFLTGGAGKDPGGSPGGQAFQSPNISLDDPSNPYFGTPGVGLNANNPPSYPRYRSSVDPSTNQVQDAYSYRSQWLPIANAQLNSNLRGAADQGAALGARTAAATRSNLAMRGGLSSGAAERINLRAERDAADASQRILNDANTNRLGLVASATDKDMQTALGDLGSSNAYNMGLFQTMANLYGANRTADAQAAAARPRKNIFGGDSFLIPGLL